MKDATDFINQASKGLHEKFRTPAVGIVIILCQIFSS
jgi:hypothetical protein